MRCSLARTDNTNNVTTLGVPHDYDPPLTGYASCQESCLILRVIQIWNRCGEWVSKHRAGLFKRNAVLGEVRCCFLRVPLDSRYDSLP